MKFLILLFCFCYGSLAEPELDTQWWKHTIIYQILPFSFKDSNGDGIGDLKGITSKLDHFVDLGIETLHLAPMYETELRDIGYDITDFCKVDPRYGTMDDFDELIREVKKRNMKLVLDLVINHSSHKHEWFQKSIDRIDPYTDFYIWKDSKGYDFKKKEELVPNNWISVFNRKPGKAWKWNEKRGQFYFHQFLEEQADLNLENEILQGELIKIIKFWLDKGVSGFRIDAVNFFFEDKDFRDDDFHLRQMNQPETYDFVHKLRVFLDDYNKEHGGFERIFMAEAHCNWDCVRKYYDKDNYTITHFPYTYNLRHIASDIKASNFHHLTSDWIETLPTNAVSAWLVQDHDGLRLGNKVRLEYMDIMTIASMLLPGVMCAYYGQEIGMINGYILPHQIRDHSGGGSRDPARLPMQWDSTLNAGFSDNIETFLPVNPDYYNRNVELQKKQNISHYNLFKDLSQLRKTDTFKFGNFKSHKYSMYQYAFTRSYNQHMFIIIINFHASPSVVNLKSLIKLKEYNIFLVAASTNAKYEKGYKPSRHFLMTSFSSVVFEAIRTQ